MKRALAVFLAMGLALGFLTLTAQPAAAHGPCEDSDGDGEPSGKEYGIEHIAHLAKAGGLGQDHKPGVHRGFAICLGL